MSEIEDVTGVPAGAIEHFLYAALQFRSRREQSNRVQVALDRNLPSEGRPTYVQWHSPIQSDDGPSRLPHQL